MKGLVRDAGGWAHFSLSVIIAVAIAYFLIWAVRQALNSAATAGVPVAGGASGALGTFEKYTQPY